MTENKESRFPNGDWGADPRPPLQLYGRPGWSDSDSGLKQLCVELASMLEIANCPELAEKPGSVSIIFWDGEWCSTKSGDLLWLRTLHMFKGGISGLDIGSLLPGGKDGRQFMFMDYDAAKEIRAHLGKIATYVEAQS